MQRRDRRVSRQERRHDDANKHQGEQPGVAAPRFGLGPGRTSDLSL